MKFIGAHVSISGGVYTAPVRAHQIGAKAFGMFVKNQRQWRAAPLKEEDIQLFKRHCRMYGFDSEFILPHAGYLINLATVDKLNAARSLESFVDEINRCHSLGLTKINVHPGAHLGKISEKEAIELVASNINRAIEQTESVCIVIENTAGEGTHVGYRFEHLKRILELVDDKQRIGVCIDTCHLFAAGYNISTEDAYESTFDAFERIVGFEWLKGVHLNDARSALGSRVDRHESIGSGNIGVDAFRMMMEDSRFDGIPMILETPRPELWKREIAMLYEFCGNDRINNRRR